MQQNEKTEIAKFSKLDLLASCGLLDRKFNYASGEFESSLRYRLWSYLVLIAEVTFLLPLYVSPFFGKQDIIQLWIGSPVMPFPEY